MHVLPYLHQLHVSYGKTTCKFHLLTRAVQIAGDTERDIDILRYCTPLGSCLGAWKLKYPSEYTVLISQTFISEEPNLAYQK